MKVELFFPTQIPDYLDFFSIESGQDIEIYLVQEYVEGTSLAQLVREGKHFSQRDVIEIALDILRILEYLHTLSPHLRTLSPLSVFLLSIWPQITVTLFLLLMSAIISGAYRPYLKCKGYIRSIP